MLMQHFLGIVIFSLISFLISSCSKDSTPTNTELCSLKGIVYKVNTSMPIEGVTVATEGKSTITDSDGSFIIESIPCGQIIVTATKTGYEDYADTINTSLDIIDNLIIYMYLESSSIWVNIPAGPYIRAVTGQLDTIDYNYEIMKYEVTNKQYAEFLNDALISGKLVEITDSVITGYYEGDSYYPAGIYTFYDSKPYPATPAWFHIGKILWNGDNFGFSSGYGNHPVIFVTWFGAYAYANHYDLKLPTPEEWEKAARGNTENIFPWGNTINGNRANFGLSDDPWEVGTTPVGYYNGQNNTIDSPSPFGTYDMLGNVEEYIDGFWDSDPDERLVIGGSYRQYLSDVIIWWDSYGSINPSQTWCEWGFRCVKK